MTTEEAKRKLTAVLHADVKGYSRLMTEDDMDTVGTLTAYKEMMIGLVDLHQGRVVDVAGDGFLIEFPSVVAAVWCAVEFQQAIKARNAELPENRRMEFRIGINLGDVIEKDERIFGDGVNIAARLEGLAEGGGICISGYAYDQIKNKMALRYEYVGEQAVKNITDPVRVYRVRMEPEEPSAEEGVQKPETTSGTVPVQEKPSVESDESQVLPLAGSRKKSSHRKLALLFVVIFLVISAISAYHFLPHSAWLSENSSRSTPSETGQPSRGIPDEPGTSPASIVIKGSPPSTLKGKDDAALRFVPGGDILLPTHFGQRSLESVRVKPLYMDETLVTNRQYVGFLNKVLPKLHVERGTVRREGTIWLMLGEVIKGYEPIVFRDGRFSVKDPAFAFRPVVRVTGYGAVSYAGHYGRRLPTELEWLAAMNGDGNPPKRGPENTGGAPGRQPSTEPPSPVVYLTPNAYGIRGLGKIVGEWGLRSLEISAQQKPETEYVVIGGLEGRFRDGTLLLPGVARHPWEAFEEVGFRCALSIKIENGE